jgi:hypothetical protein
MFQKGGGGYYNVCGIEIKIVAIKQTMYIRDLTRILRPLVTFAEQIFFGLIMNKQEYNELNLIISYVTLLVSKED